MNVFASEEDPNPFYTPGMDFCSEKSNQSIFNIRVVNSLDVATDHHVEEKKSNEHYELLNYTVPHFKSEILSIIFEEGCLSDSMDSASVN